MQPKIIFSDIDGTLINTAYQVTPDTKKALQKAIQNGVRFVPVSARMPEAMQTVTDHVDPHCALISYNGALILDDQKNVVASFPLDRSIAQEICRFIEQEHPEITWNAYGHHDWLGQDHDRQRVEFEESIVKVISTPAKISDIAHMKDVHKLLMMGEPEDLDIVEGLLKEAYPALSIARSSRILLEIMNQGIRKGAAIQKLCAYYGVDVADTIAFGDNYNDLDMLQTAGAAYVMGNAPQEIKDLFPNVTDDNNHDGIARVLEKLEENR